MELDNEKVSAQLKLDEGPSYKIDSIRVFGDVKISNEFLQRYLDIRNGSSFNKEKLLRISRRMRELTYVEEEYPSKLDLAGYRFYTGNVPETKKEQPGKCIGWLFT